MGAFELDDAVPEGDDGARARGGDGRDDGRSRAMKSVVVDGRSARVRAREDGDAYGDVEMSQREMVTYHAPAAASGHSSRATSECGSRERDSAALTRLFHMGSATTTTVGGGANGEEELGTWLSGNEGGGGEAETEAKRARRMTHERGGRERTRGSVPAAPPWDESPVRSRSRERRGRGSGDGGRRRSEDVLEELMSNFSRRQADATTRDAGVDVEVKDATMTPSSDAMVVDGAEENVAPVASLDDYWDDDEDEAIIAAAALAEKHHAEKKGAARAASAREETIPSLDGFGDDDDDDEDLLAAAAAAVVDRAQTQASREANAEPSSANGTVGSTRAAVKSTENESPAIDDVEVKKEFAKDEAEADLMRELRLIEEETNAESEILGTWIVEAIDSPYPGKILSVSLKKPNGDTKKIALKDEWGESPFEVGDSIGLYCLNEDAKRRLERDVVDISAAGGILPILYPSYLVSATTVGTSFKCLRQTVISQQVQHTWGDANEAATVGTIMHELAEKALLSASGRNPEPMEVSVERLIRSMTNAIFEIDYTERQLKKRIDETIPGVQRWASKLAALSRVTKLPRATVGGNALARRNRKAAIDKLRNRCTEGVDFQGKVNEPGGTLQVDDIIDIEELIWAPKLGLKGILDGVASAVVRRPNKRPEEILTPSIVPIELKTGKWRDVGHDAQVFLYTLMIGERYGAVSPFGVLHYTNDGQNEEGESKVMSTHPRELGFLIQQRNRLAAVLHPTPEMASRDALERRSHGTARIGNGKLPKMQPQEWCERCFARDECFTLHRALEAGNGETSELGELFETCTTHLTPKHEAFLRRWLHLIDLESSENLRKRATPWLSVELVNRRDGFAIDELRLLREVTDDLSNGDGRHYYDFALPASCYASGLKRLQIADRVVLSRDGGMTTICRAQIMAITEGTDGFCALMSTERPLRLDNPEDKLEALPGSAKMDALWRIDKDGASLTMSARTRGNMLALFGPTERSAVIRRRIVDLQRPAFSPLSGVKMTLERSLRDLPFPMNAEQIAAVEKIVTAQDYALVLGLPGAGKTATLVAAVKALRALGKSVLITSHTHSAIDNILSRLPAVGITDFMRIGDEVKVAPGVREYMLGSERWPCSVSDDMRKISDVTGVTGATCYAMGHAYFQRKTYDVVLVDESGQITLPNIIPPLCMAKTFVLVGDHYQLPPLVVSKRAVAGGLNKSLFATLCETHEHVVDYLSMQYRMAEPLTQLPNALTYDGKLKCGTEAVARQTLELRPPSGAFADAPDWLRRVMDPNAHCVFLDTSAIGPDAHETPPPTINETEMDVVLAVVCAFVRHGAAAENVCTLSPFNAQVDALQARLNESQIFRGVESLTIDRAQGRDMDAVCVSFVRSNDARVAGELLDDESRFNVAITRAKKKLILIGDAETLKSSSVIGRAIDFYRARGWTAPLGADAVRFARRALAESAPTSVF